MADDQKAKEEMVKKEVDGAEVSADDATEDKKVEKVELEVAVEPGAQAVEKAIEKVASFVEDLVARHATPPAEPKAEGASDDVDDVKKEENNEEETPRVVFAKQLKDAGVEGVPFDAAMAAFDKMPTVSTEKSEDEPKPADADVEKAEKADNVKKEESTLATDLAAITKSIGDLANVFKQQTEVNKDLGERVEKIEKVRNPSQSVEADGDTDNKVEKSEKPFWAGVL